MSKLANGSGAIKRLTSRLTAAKGTVPAVVVTAVLIAGAGFGLMYIRGASPAASAADSAPTATAPEATTSALEPTLAAAATPAPPATPPPTVTSGPQLSVIPVMYIQEPTGCGAQ